MNRIIYILIFLVSFSTMTQANPGKEVSINYQSVKKVGDEVAISMEIEVKKWNPKYRLIISPVIYNDQNQLELKPVTIVGRVRHIADQRAGMASADSYVLKNKASKTIAYEVTVPYCDWMAEVSIGVEQQLEGCCVIEEEERLAIAEDKLLYHQVIPEFSEVIYDYEFTELEKFTLENPFLHPSEDYDQRFELFKNDKEKKSVQVYFKQGVSKIDINFGNNRDVLSAMEAAFTLINATPDAQLSKVVIAGFASPEGSEAVNNRLAEQRAIAVREFIKTIMTERYSEDIFEFFNGGKDWDGLLNMLDRSPGLPGCEEAIEIIKNHRHQEDCNDRLKKINNGKTYAYMLKELYPHLRNAGFVQVYYDIIRTAEIATLVTDDEGRTTWIDPESPANVTITRLNEATSLMTKGNFDKALELLLEIQEDPRSFNHLGVCYMMQHEYTSANYWLEKAVASGDAYANKNLFHIQQQLRVEK